MKNKKPHLSASQIDMYCRCGEQYRRRYIEREILPPGIALVQGVAVHDGSAFNFSQKIKSHADLKSGIIEEKAIDALEQKIKAEGLELSSEDEKAKGKQGVIDQAKENVAKFIGLYSTELAPKYQPTLVEEWQTIQMPSAPYDILGRLDLVDDQKRIIDLKTAGKSKQQSDADNSVQLSIYAASMKIKTGEYPAEMRLEILVNKETPELQTLSTHRTIDDMVALKNRINAVIKGVTSEVFTPAIPGSWWCSARFCGYWQTCPFINSKSGGSKNEIV